MEHVVRVDMTSRTTRIEDVPAEFADLGGRALTAAWVSAAVPPDAHPLGPKNVLVVAPGLLGGTKAANSSRLSIGAKSPLTGGSKESNVGGTPGDRLARQGIRAIVIEGQAKDGPYVLKVGNGKAELAAAPELKGLGNYATVERLGAAESDEEGGKLSSLTIGPAGEMKLAAASIAATSTNGAPSRHAARGGMGAVMGSKGLKAIVIEGGRGIRPPVSDEARLNETAVAWRELLTSHPASQGLGEFGTPNTAWPINEIGDYPTRNFSLGRFDQIDKVTGQTIHDTILERGGKVGHAGCSNCVIRCSNEFVDKDGAPVTSSFEYETIGMLGANLDISDVDYLARFDHLLDDIGVDSIDVGAAIGVAMEAGVKSFGDAEGVIELLEEVRAGTPMGRVIGSGAATVGKVLGVTRVPVVKGQAMAAYDPRALLGQGVGYATSPMGADHTACFAPAQSVFGIGEYVDPLKVEGQVDYARILQIGTAMIDALGLCLMVAFPLFDNPGAGLPMLADLLTAKTGREWSVDDLMALGTETIRTEIAFNRAAGLSRADDRLPEFFKDELLGPLEVTFTVSDEELDNVFGSLEPVPES